MQNFTIEHRAPRKGEAYVCDLAEVDELCVCDMAREKGRFGIRIAAFNLTEPRPVLVPIAPAWPDKPVIVIEKGVRAGETLNKGVIAVREAGTLDYLDEYGNVWIANADTITAWHEYVPDGYVPRARYQGLIDYDPTERVEYTADDLDQLPEGSIAFDANGEVWQRGPVHWFVAGGCGIFTNPLREGFRCHFYSAPEPGESA